MSRWEKKVTASLDDIFADSEEEKESESKEDDVFADASNEEINDIFEEVKKETEEDYLKDIDNYFSDNEQTDLVSNGVHLTMAKKFMKETGFNPLRGGIVTDNFKEWLEENFPKELKYLKEKSEEKKEPERNPLGETWEEEYILHTDCVMCEKDRFFVSKYNGTCIVCDGIKTEKEYAQLTERFSSHKTLPFSIKKESKLNEYKYALTWLYKFMNNLDFGDYSPTDKEIELLEDIEKLIKDE